MTLTAHLTNHRAARDRCGGYLVEWVDGQSYHPDVTEANAEATQVAKTWQATVWRLDRDGVRDRVVSAVPGAGSGDVVVVQFGGAAERKVAA